MKENKIIIKKYLFILFIVLLVNFSIITMKAWCLQDEKKPDFEMVAQNGHSSGVGSLSFNPDGKYIVSSSGNIIKLWNLKGNFIKIFKGRALRRG
jgi:WD40 repeat protein